jgi:hypothetical protein
VKSSRIAGSGSPASSIPRGRHTAGPPEVRQQRIFVEGLDLQQVAIDRSTMDDLPLQRISDALGRDEAVLNQ